MINVKQLIEYVIEPSLKAIDMCSEEAVNLLVGTAAVESNLGTYIHQVGGGPACGIWQMEPKTYDDIIKNYLKYRPNICVAAHDFLGVDDPFNPYFFPAAQDMCGNMYLACIFARLHYARVPERLPPADSVIAQAKYWKKYYNTALGAGTEEKYINAYPL